ncbi:glycosyltransferase family 4 protein [Pararhizobium sp.]|uniref:glycosyltransferase family 4 protein n=1 Tax=Pararhizobium sp. TaxID=1977563 RepID=UPI00271A0965|nr:glycosyltransferase family 4 protein [Pararhizobium sp.]MDO9415987.1 glycosyltransferase family 4 protein [Pararhizobium sp.]
MTTDGTSVTSRAAAVLRLLQVLEPSGGGSGRHFLDLCAGLKARGHHVHAIYSPVRAEQGFVADLQALGLAAVDAVDMKRAPGPSDIAAYRAISSIIARNGPFDAIHGHSSKAGALTRLRLPGRHVPRVYTPHAFRTMDPTLGKGGRLIYGGIETVLAKFWTDRLICVSDDERRHALSIGVPEDKIAVVVNGVSPPPAGQRDAIRARFGISPDDLVYGFVGRLSQQKAPERLMQAFQKIAATVPASHLLMIGFGEQEAELRALIGQSGLSGRIHLTADIAGASAMAAFDLLVMPSRYEAMSYVLLEAAAAGRPIVITDVGGASNVVDNGVNGLIVANSDDVTALAAAMQRLADPAELTAFTAQAMTRRDRYSLEVMIDKTEAVYRSLQLGR